MILVPCFLAFMAAQTSYDYGQAPAPRMRHEMNVAYRTLSDCLIAAERKNDFYRRGYRLPACGLLRHRQPQRPQVTT